MGLAPWDEAGFFQTPLATAVSVGSNAVVLAPADPTRVLLTFSNMTQSTLAVITPNIKIATTGTFMLLGGQTIILNYDWFGPLTQIAWYGFSSGGTTIGIHGVSLNGYPKPKGGGLYGAIQALSAAIRNLTNNSKPAATK